MSPRASVRRSVNGHVSRWYDALPTSRPPLPGSRPPLPGSHDADVCIVGAGYTGHGVTATNLAARTLMDLVLNRATALTALPWVGHRSRRWEPEPLRWLGVRGM